MIPAVFNGLALLYVLAAAGVVVGVLRLDARRTDRKRARRRITVQGWQQILAWMYP